MLLAKLTVRWSHAAGGRHIGISSSDTSSRRSLLADADEALYRSKANGGGHTEAWAAWF